MVDEWSYVKRHIIYIAMILMLAIRGALVLWPLFAAVRIRRYMQSTVNN